MGKLYKSILFCGLFHFLFIFSITASDRDFKEGKLVQTLQELVNESFAIKETEDENNQDILYLSYAFQLYGNFSDLLEVIISTPDLTNNQNKKNKVIKFLSSEYLNRSLQYSNEVVSLSNIQKVRKMLLALKSGPLNEIWGNFHQKKIKSPVHSDLITSINSSSSKELQRATNRKKIDKNKPDLSPRFEIIKNIMTHEMDNYLKSIKVLDIFTRKSVFYNNYGELTAKLSRWITIDILTSLGDNDGLQSKFLQYLQLGQTFFAEGNLECAQIISSTLNFVYFNIKKFLALQEDEAKSFTNFTTLFSGGDHYKGFFIALKNKKKDESEPKLIPLSILMNSKLNGYHETSLPRIKNEALSISNVRDVDDYLKALTANAKKTNDPTPQTNFDLGLPYPKDLNFLGEISTGGFIILKKVLMNFYNGNSDLSTDHKSDKIELDLNTEDKAVRVILDKINELEQPTINNIFEIAFEVIKNLISFLDEDMSTWDKLEVKKFINLATQANNKLNGLDVDKFIETYQLTNGSNLLLFLIQRGLHHTDGIEEYVSSLISYLNFPPQLRLRGYSDFISDGNNSCGMTFASDILSQSDSTFRLIKNLNELPCQGICKGKVKCDKCLSVMAIQSRNFIKADEFCSSWQTAETFFASHFLIKPDTPPEKLVAIYKDIYDRYGGVRLALTNDSSKKIKIIKDILVYCHSKYSDSMTMSSNKNFAAFESSCASDTTSSKGRK